MCTYTRTLFSCKHEIWGRRVKRCHISKDHVAGRLPFDCVLRTPHGLQSKRLSGSCKKCTDLKEKFASAREKLEDCRRALQEIWPDYTAASSTYSPVTDGAVSIKTV